MALSRFLPPFVINSDIVALATRIAERMCRLSAPSEFGEKLLLGSINCICSICSSPALIRYRGPNGGRWDVL